jgi:hypothetical protein
MENNACVPAYRELSMNDHLSFQRLAVGLMVVSFFYTLASDARA